MASKTPTGGLPRVAPTHAPQPRRRNSVDAPQHSPGEPGRAVSVCGSPKGGHTDIGETGIPICDLGYFGTSCPRPGKVVVHALVLLRERIDGVIGL